jgi:predicted protein tyrosine phosphatase
MNIYVTNLFDLPMHVRALRPGYLVSIIQPEFQPDTPAEITPARHHRVDVHDISEPRPGSIVPGHEHITSLVDFLTEWPLDQSLMVHCYAGVSRSTAAALIGHFIKTGDEHASASALRAAAPHALPNRRIIALADDILGCGGRLVAAREAMGHGESVVEGPLVTLSLAP